MSIIVSNTTPVSNLIRMEEQNFRIHPDLRRRVLEQAGEAP